MVILLEILAILLFIAGVYELFMRQFLWGVILIVLACLVGPGGYSIFH